MKITSVFTKLGLISIIVLLCWGCGKEQKAALDDDIANSAAIEASDAISQDDLAEMETGTGGLSPLGLFPQGLKPLVSPPPGSVLIFLDPNNLKARLNLLRVARAPLDALMYFYATGCATIDSGTCPKLGDINKTCTISLPFTAGCNTITVPTISGPLNLTFSGGLSGTIEGNYNNTGLPKVWADAANFKAADEVNNRWINYNGAVSRQITGIYGGLSPTGASWILSVDIGAEDSAGASGTANGTRTVEVEFGKYFHARNVGTLTFIPPGSINPVTIDVSIERTIYKDKAALTKTIIINDTILTNGIRKTLTGKMTLSGELRGGSGELESVTINGSLARSGPKGSVTITFDDVVIKLNCNHNPWGGTVTVSNGEKTYKFDFRQDCGCIVDITKPDGSTVEYNICT